MMRKTDAALLERWVTVRDPEAFSEIVERHAGMVLATCRRVLGNAADAEDATQDCFLKLSQANRASVHSLGGWLHRMATNRALDRLRSETRRAAREKAYTEERPTVVEPVWDDIQPHVDAIIAELPEDLQAPLVLHFFEGHSHREVGKALGLSRSAVTGRIQRAVGAIREKLDTRGIAVGLAALTALFEAYEVQAASPVLVASLNKIGLAAGRPVAAALPLGGKLGIAAAAMAVLTGIVWVALPRDAGNEVAASAPVARLIETVEDPVDETPAPEFVLAAAVEEEPAVAVPAEEMTRLRCVDIEGSPVEGAEVYYVQSERKLQPMTEDSRPDDTKQTPFGPVLTDAEGYVDVPGIAEADDIVGTYYSAYARVPGKLVGVWLHSPRTKKDDGWNTLTMVEASPLTGTVSVPAGFSPTTVTAQVLTLRIQTGDIGYGASFNASSKYQPPLWPELFTATPKPDGTFTLPDMPAKQSFYLAFTAPGLGETQYYKFNSDGTETVAVELHREATISGTVRYTNGGPVVDAPVFARPFGGRNSGIGVTTSFLTHTDSLGRYTITGLPREVYSVKVQHYGQPPEWISGVIPAMEVMTGGRYTDIDFVVERGALQEGTIVEAASGAPIPDVWLIAMNPGDTDNLSTAQSVGASKTNADGKFQFRLPTGVSFVYYFMVPEGYTYPDQQGRTYITVDPGQATLPPLEFTLTKKTEEEMAPIGEATIEGRVVAPDGQPLADVPVAIGWKYKHGNNDRQRQTPSRPTDEDGRFSVNVRATGEHQLVVGGGQFSRIESEWFTADTDEPSTFPDLVVERYVHTISVTVTNFSDALGVSRPYVSVSAKDTGDPIAGGSVDESGHIELWVPDVPLKGYTGQRGSKTVDFEIEPGATIEVWLEPSE